MSRNTTRYCFIVTAITLAFLYILWSHTKSHQWVLNELFIWGFLGLAVINILLFVLPMCGGLRTLWKSSVKSESQERNSEKAEEKLVSLLQGDTVAHHSMPAWARIGIAVCLGLIVGSVLGFVLNRIILRVF